MPDYKTVRAKATSSRLVREHRDLFASTAHRETAAARTENHWELPTQHRRRHHIHELNCSLLVGGRNEMGSWVGGVMYSET